MIDAKMGWDQLERSIRFAEDLTRSADDGLEEVVERYPAVRRFALTFLAAFTFRTARSGDPLLGAIDRRAYEIAVIVQLHEWLGSGSIWLDGSRAYRTLDDYQLPVPRHVKARA